MTKLVRQKLKSDCAICCITMALQADYPEIQHKEVLKVSKELKAFSYKTRMSLQDEEKVLDYFGYSLLGCWWDTLSNYELKLGDSTSMSRVSAFSNEEIWSHYLDGRPALISVKSLNFEDCGHALFWDGQKLFDPSNLKRYRKRQIGSGSYIALIKRRRNARYKINWS